MKRRRINWVSEEIGKALLVSKSIRKGIHGRHNNVFLLKSLVDAFEKLVSSLVEFNSTLPRPQDVTNPDRGSTRDPEDGPNTVDGPDAVGTMVMYHPTMPTDDQYRRVSQHPYDPDSPSEDLPLEDSPAEDSPLKDSPWGTKIYPEGPVSGRNPREQAILGTLVDVRKKLECAKIEILELFGYQNPLDLTAHSTVSTSGIIAFVISSLTDGDCDIPSLLSPENAYRSSMFSTSDRKVSDTVVRLDLRGLYQEYCSKLVRPSV